MTRAEGVTARGLGGARRAGEWRARRDPRGGRRREKRRRRKRPNGQRI